MLIRSETHCSIASSRDAKSSSGRRRSLLFKFGQFLVSAAADRHPVRRPHKMYYTYTLGHSLFRDLLAILVCMFLCGPAGWRIACRAVYVQYLITVIAIMYRKKRQRYKCCHAIHQHLPRTVSLFYATACLRLFLYVFAKKLHFAERPF
jgi:hypothetical protein